MVTACGGECLGERLSRPGPAPRRRGGEPRGQHHDLVARLEDATRDRARVAAVVVQRRAKYRCWGRITYCTGNRASIRLRSEAMWTFSRWCSSGVPSYQAMLPLRCTTLSPCSADIGTNATSCTSSFIAKLRKSSRISSKRSCDQSTRSILLMHTTVCGIPSRLAMNAWRRDCSSTPLRASTSTSATSAVDAPVTMLRVYWAWPGVSAMMNLRLGVAK